MRQICGLLLVAGLGAQGGFASGLAAQASGYRGGVPLEPAHWAVDLLDLLDAAGGSTAWTGTVGPPASGAVLRGLDRGGVGGSVPGAGGAVARPGSQAGAPGWDAVRTSWERRFLEEFPVREAPRRGSLPPGARPRGPAAPAPVNAAMAFAGGYRKADALLAPGDGWVGELSGDALLGSGVRSWASWRRGGGHTGPALARVGVSAPVGPWIVGAVRHPLRLGPGQHDPLLSGSVALDALWLRSDAPLGMGPLGRIAFSASLSRLEQAGDVEEPFFGTMAATLAPARWLRLGGTRTAVFGGRDRPDVTTRRVLRMVAGRHSTHDGEFEDQHAALFVEILPVLAGQPFRVHGLLAVNDSEGGVRDDPAVVAGLTVPRVGPSGLWGFRYEYEAFGARARLCPGCEVRWPRGWYNHYEYGDHMVDGLPLGSPLGGYGASHTASVSWFEPGGSVQLGVALFQERREEANLLLGRWPGKWEGAELDAHLFPEPGARMSVRARALRSRSGATAWGGELSLHKTVGLER